MLMVVKFLMSSIFVMTMMMILMTITKKSINDKEKSSPFECGFNPMSKKRMPFSIHFFIIAVIFMIFDVEIALLMPMIMTMKQTIMIKWMNTSIMFMLLLTMGLYHEWYNGMISWTK